jgi:1-acyl-sn-glycerol-3-phosphate acyltransferase
VLASNHVSYLDFIFCGFAARPSHRLVRFMAKKSTFDHRVSGPLMKSMHHIPVDRSAGAHAMDSAVSSLREGEVVGVFPEATISQSFELKDFKTGAVRMAAEAGVPVVPMITFGGQRLWTKGHKREMERGSLISLAVGSPLSFTEADDPVEATALLKTQMQELFDDVVSRYPAPPAGTWWWPARFGGGAPSLAQMQATEESERQAREGGA